MITANRIELEGFAYTEAQDFASKQGKPFTRFYLALPGKKQDGTAFNSYYDISSYDDKIRDAMHKGVFKGATVRVEGYLSSFKNQNNGQTYFNLSIHPTRIMVGDKAPENNNQYNAAAQQTAQQVSMDNLSMGKGQPASWINPADLPF